MTVDPKSRDSSEDEVESSDSATNRDLRDIEQGEESDPRRGESRESEELPTGNDRGSAIRDEAI